MTPTERFIERLKALKEGERSRLRRLAGQGLDKSVPGFDLFTGVWWPLRQKSPAAPRREASWLVAKLYGAVRVPHVPQDCAFLPVVLGRREPHDDFGRERYRRRFDALLQAPLAALEPHLRWALCVAARRASGVDWVRLLNDLSKWDRDNEDPGGTDVREKWACQYLEAAKVKGETGHAD
jgi:hypothetical protein